MPPELLPRLRWLGLALLYLIGTSLILLVPLLLQQGEPLGLRVGDVAPDDILAPRSLTYTSEIQTDAAREAAARAVSDIYDPPDTRIVRQQVTSARNILNYIASVRADTFASDEQRLTDLRAVRDISISADTAETLLSLNEDPWKAIQAEVPSVIEEVMSATVTEPRLGEARSEITRQVSVNLSVTEAEVVAALAQPLVVPNALFNETSTENARAAARDAVAPVTVSFIQGQTVVERGRVINVLDYEALTALGLLEPVEESLLPDQTARVMAAVLTLVLLMAYLGRLDSAALARPGYMTIILLLFLALLAVAAWLVPNNVVFRYLIPASSLAILASVLLGSQLAIVLSIVFGLLIGVLSYNLIDLSLFMVLGSIMAVLTLGKAERVSSFFWAGFAAAVINGLVVLAFRLADPETDVVGLVTLIGAAFANGIISASVTLVLVFVLSTFFGITTSLQLIELMRPDHPLLQELLRKAPGTYQHSLQIANLTEQAAEVIDANALLCRVGALYHDIGKSRHPQFFIENQVGHENPHERLDPRSSAQIIIGHVTEGLQMARNRNLPAVIRDAIAEHHGDGVTMYQYTLAQQQTDDPEQLDIAAFTYPGPKPQSRETGLLMLADGIEAKSRADLPANDEEIRAIVDAIVDSRLREGQLNESGLTLNDIEAARESFVATLHGIYHTRIKYPPEAAQADEHETLLPEGV